MAAHAERLRAALRAPADARGAAALVAGARFAERLRDEGVAHGAALAEADARAAAARGEVAACQAALAAARGALRALERHRDRWLAERRRRLDRAEEEALEDAVSGRRARP